MSLAVVTWCTMQRQLNILFSIWEWMYKCIYLKEMKTELNLNTPCLCYVMQRTTFTNWDFHCCASAATFHHSMHYLTFLDIFLVRLHQWSSPSVSPSPVLSSWWWTGLWAPRTTQRARWLLLWNPPWRPTCSPLSVLHKTHVAWEKVWLTS